jgi:hypothetical protein
MDINVRQREREQSSPVQRADRLLIHRGCALARYVGTLVASRREDLFRKYVVGDPREIRGELKVNPLYRIDPQGDSSVLTLTFPTPEYEEEFGACKQYLPSTVTVPGDVRGPIVPGALGPQYDELRRRRVIIDAPPDYC